jgi:hypothetical protein
MKKNMVGGLVIAGVILSSITLFYLSNNKLSTLQDCQSVINNEKSFISPEAEKVSLDCYLKVLLDKAEKETPSQALDELFAFVADTNKENLNIDCHSIIHAVGYGFYEQYKEKSLIADKELCNYGYYHGVFQRSIELKLNDYKKFLDIICEGKKEANLTFCKAAVSHGYGHSVATGNADYTQGFSICDLILVENEYSIEEENCSYGYLMEKIKDSEFPFTAENCLSAGNTSLIRGCLTGVASLLVRNDVDMAMGCPADLFTAFEINMCYRGFGYAVGEKILNYEINNEGNILSYDKKLFNDCSNNQSCSSGAGSMLGSYFQQNQERANNLCMQYLPIEGTLPENGKENEGICISSVASTQLLTAKK